MFATFADRFCKERAMPVADKRVFTHLHTHLCRAKKCVLVNPFENLAAVLFGLLGKICGVVANVVSVIHKFFLYSKSQGKSFFDHSCNYIWC